MELARGSFQDENSVPLCKKYHSLAHTSKNLYVQVLGNFLSTFLLFGAHNFSKLQNGHKYGARGNIFFIKTSVIML